MVAEAGGGAGHRAALSRPAALWLVGGAAVAAALVRLPLLGLPLDPDEGGYALIARRWALGAPLYSAGAWVDRPPALLLLYRVVTSAADSPTGLRVAAMFAAAILTVGVGAAGWVLAGRDAGVVAAVAVAVVAACPFVQGYELNGELLAAVPCSWAVALAFAWREGRLGTGWLGVAGALAGTAPLIKQSALDGAAVLVLMAVVAGRRRHSMPVIGVGLALPLSLTLLWAALTGWPRFWYAVVGFQAELATEQPLRSRLSGLVVAAAVAAPALLGLVLVAVLGAAVARKAPDRYWPALAWACVALLGVVSGPFAHLHYWVQVVPPLAVLGGIGAASLRGRAAIGAVTVAIAVPLAVQAILATQPAARRTPLVIHDQQLLSEDAVALWLRTHTRPTDQVYAFVAAAGLYLEVGRTTSYPYLWDAAIQELPWAKTELARWLSSQNGPRYVVVYQPPITVDPTGTLTRTLGLWYEQVATVHGYAILERRTLDGPKSNPATASAKQGLLSLRIDPPRNGVTYGRLQVSR